MSSLKTYLATLITDPALLDVTMVVLVVVMVSVFIKILGFGLYDRKG